MEIVLSVSKARVRGATFNSKGQKVYRKGTKSYWTAYLLDEFGRFRTERVSSAMVPILKMQVQHFSTYECDFCRTKFRSNKRNCPKCGSKDTERIRRRS